jgi:peptidoglycan/LPS O-acetylase OafA/YrhL
MNSNAMDLPAPKTRRYDTLDHWRGVACLVVLINHSVWTGPDSATWTGAERTFVALANRLWLGVPMFFVISGYCIAATVDAHRRRERRSLSSYLARRVRRIFPPYWIVLAATVLAVATIDVLVAGRPLTSGPAPVFLRPWWYSVWQWVGNVTLTEQWRMNVVGGQKAWFLVHAWTLSYEEQFYLVAAVILWLMPRNFFAGALAVSLVVALTGMSMRLFQLPLDGFFLDGSWLQFYLGVLVYFAINYGSAGSQRLLCMVLVAATALMPVFFDTFGDLKTVSQSFFVAVPFAAALIPLQRFDSLTSRARVLEPLRYAGLMCYSLYLLHLPLNKMLRAWFQLADLPSSPWLTVPACAALSLPLAWLFHLGVERRFMAPGRSTGSVRQKLPDPSPIP